MVRVMVWGFLLCQAAFIFSASISTGAEDSTEVDYDTDYEYSDEYIETESEEEEADIPRPRSRVLFDEEENSSIIHFKVSGKETRLNRKIAFTNPESRSEEFEMTLKEINEIFGKKRHSKNKKGKLSRSDKKLARDCRKKHLLFSKKDNKCHEPTSEGPCNNDKWFVAVKGKLEGVCRRNQCTSDETPILFNGTCSALFGVCPNSSRLYLNKRGEGFCDCDQGFSYNIEDDKCHREHTQGPCTDKQTWLRRKTPKNHKTGHKVFGKCKENKCGEGEVEWKDEKCYTVDRGDMINMCLESQQGELVIENEVLACTMVTRGRAVAMGIGRSCRRGRAWSSYRNRCVRVYSRG
eukprot:GFUD01030146.1.p1 GENE.GFUD01030146.1~~GFUD01030146.1.p1  ORF type:complete len:350 (-),score=77.24 GFUD01030146.1:126-1175(-)